MQNHSSSGKKQEFKQTSFVCKLACPVFFVGFMGAGKTSVARRLARMCHIVSVDMDAYIERRENKRISAIFAEQGEEAFRSIESTVLKEFASGEPCLVSCGGGVVLCPKNREVLKTNGFVVYLRVLPDEAFDRISDMSTRPLLKDRQAAHKINEQRIPYYEEVADVIIDTASGDIYRTVREVKEILQKERLLWQEPK